MSGPLLPQIPDPSSDPNSMLATIRLLRQAMQTLSLNAAGSSTAAIFTVAASEGKTAAMAGNVSTGTDATASFTLSAPSGVVVLFSYTGAAASAAGNLILAVDGSDLVTLPLAIIAGNAYPQTGFTFIGNLGPGPHSVSVRTSTGLSGFSIAVIGSKR